MSGRTRSTAAGPRAGPVGSSFGLRPASPKRPGSRPQTTESVSTKSSPLTSLLRPAERVIGLLLSGRSVGGPGVDFDFLNAAHAGEECLSVKQRFDGNEVTEAAIVASAGRRAHLQSSAARVNGHGIALADQQGLAHRIAVDDLPWANQSGSFASQDVFHASKSV